MKKFKLFNFCVVFCIGIYWFSPVFSQSNNAECRVYLNFTYYSFEISGGFSQLYKIGSRYSLFSQECNSFLNFVFTNPCLKKRLFSNDKNMCNVYYESFFNRCRCDTTSFLYIYKASENSTIIEEKEIFNKKIFDASLLEIRDSAIKALNKAYPEYIIKIEISSATRSIDEQEKYFKKGSSKTLLSAHILGAAADYAVYFNEILIDPKPGAKGLYKSTEPYQILGKFILDKGYFWGIPWDPGHMQMRRKFQDILLEHPELQNNGNLIASYCSIINSDSIPLKYKPVIEILDSKFGFNENRNYDLTQPWVDDSLLLPVAVDSLFTPSYVY
ncbi:MAG: hypothetical protein V1904_03260 [Bacteroidota bacterium]